MADDSEDGAGHHTRTGVAALQGQRPGRWTELCAASSEGDSEFQVFRRILKPVDVPRLLTPDFGRGWFLGLAGARGPVKERRTSVAPERCSRTTPGPLGAFSYELRSWRRWSLFVRSPRDVANSRACS